MKATPSSVPPQRSTKERYARALEQTHPAINRSERARIAVKAGCDPRCIIRYLRAMPMKSTTTSRVERALRLCGYERFVRVPDESGVHAVGAATPPRSGGKSA
jgi:hypothetical protein